jgi:hypothetical protein
MVKRKRETKSFLFSLQSHFLSIELWVFHGIIRFHNLHDTNRLRRRKARGRGGGLRSEVAPERRAQGVGEPLLLVPASLPRSFLSASSGSVRQRRASGGREVRRGGQVEVEGLFLGDEGSASVREKEAEALPRRPSRLKIKNSEKELTVTVSATSSPSRASCARRARRRPSARSPPAPLACGAPPQLPRAKRPRRSVAPPQLRQGPGRWMSMATWCSPPLPLRCCSRARTAEAWITTRRAWRSQPRWRQA